MAMTINEIKEIMQEMGIQPQKAFGQNFLVSDHVINAICEAVHELSPQKLLEIGPGLGAITRPLTDKVMQPTVIEFDRSIAEYWRQKNLEVIESDALKVNYEKLDFDVLASNLPYQISSSLVMDLSVFTHTIRGMVLMFQKEVAQRITAEARSEAYGLLSVIAQTFWTIKSVTDAGPRDFYPAPKVASRVLRFVKKDGVQDFEERGLLRTKFLSFAKVGFSQRRKKLTSNLKAWPNGKRALGLLEEMGFDGNVRAEELSPSQFLHLFQKLCSLGAVTV